MKIKCLAETQMKGRPNGPGHAAARAGYAGNELDGTTYAQQVKNRIQSGSKNNRLNTFFP